MRQGRLLSDQRVADGHDVFRRPPHQPLISAASARVSKQKFSGVREI